VSQETHDGQPPRRKTSKTKDIQDKGHPRQGTRNKSHDRPPGCPPLPLRQPGTDQRGRGARRPGLLPQAAPNHALEPTPTASTRASLRLLARLTAGVGRQGRGEAKPRANSQDQEALAPPGRAPRHAWEHHPTRDGAPPARAGSPQRGGFPPICIKLTPKRLCNL